MASELEGSFQVSARMNQDCEGRESFANQDRLEIRIRAIEDLHRSYGARKPRIQHHQVDSHIERLPQRNCLITAQSRQRPTYGFGENLAEPPNEPKIVINDPDRRRDWRFGHLISSEHCCWN
jgi:hypothetical protein